MITLTRGSKILDMFCNLHMENSNDKHCLKVFVFGVFVVRGFPHSDWIRRDTLYFFIFSSNVGKHGPENSEYGLFSRSENKRLSGVCSCYSIGWSSWKLDFLSIWKKKVLLEIPRKTKAWSQIPKMCRNLKF